jgi:hypothetical protein
VSEQKQYTETAEPQQNNAFRDSATSEISLPQTLPEHENDIFLREKCALFVHQLPEELQCVVAAWDELPEVIRAGILAMVEACGVKI